MRLPILAAIALSGAVLLSSGGPAAALTTDLSCVWREDATVPGADETVLRFFAQRPGYAVSTCNNDRGVSHQVMSPVRTEAGVCRVSVWRYTQAGLAAAASDDSLSRTPAFEFMATPDAGECPERGKGRWISVNGVTPADFTRINSFAVALTKGSRSSERDRSCRRREDKLRRLALNHALISVDRGEDGLYVIRLLRSGMGYTVSVALTPDGACVRGYGQFIL